MIRSIFIIGDNGEVLIEKHWRAVTARSVCEEFWEEMSSHGRREDVPPVVATGKYSLFNIFRNGLFYMAVVEQEIPALFVLEFLKRIYDVHSIYLDSKVTAGKIRENFTTVYQLFEEMSDYGYPVLTEPNVLTAMVTPPSVVSRLAAAVGARSNVASALPPGATSGTPWRRQRPRYAQNEIYFDILETVNCTFEANGQLAHFSCYGVVFCNSRLSGTPDVTVMLNHPSAIEPLALHPCIRVAPWQRERVISMVPPDGKFKLMSYEIPMRQHPNMPFYCKPQILWSRAEGGTHRVSVMVGPKPMHSLSMKRNKEGVPSEAQVDTIVVRIPFPDCVQNVQLKSSQGRVVFDERTKECVWSVGKLGKEKSPELSGTVVLNPGARPPVGDSITVGCSFDIPAASVSGVRVDNMRIGGEAYRPFKGMRSLVRAGEYEFRT